MLKGELIEMIRRVYGDNHEAYSNFLCSMMDYYDVNSLQDLTYEELKVYVEKELII